jgi:hypothetical protein
MTYESRKDRTRNPRQTYRSTGRNRLSGREKAASGSLRGFARRRCRLARRHRATVLAASSAAGRKPGVRIRGEHQRAHRRQAENGHQQQRQTSEHWDHYTPQRKEPYLRQRKLHSRPPVSSSKSLVAAAAPPCAQKIRGVSPPPGCPKCGKKPPNYL